MNTQAQIVSSVKSLFAKVKTLESEISSLKLLISSKIGNQEKLMMNDIEKLKAENEELRAELLKSNQDMQRDIISRIEKLESVDVKDIINIDYINNLYRGR